VLESDEGEALGPHLLLLLAPTAARSARGRGFDLAAVWACAVAAELGSVRTVVRWGTGRRNADDLTGPDLHPRGSRRA
jgi:hypothetical protein